MHLLIQSYQIRLGRLGCLNNVFYSLSKPNETIWHSANGTTNNKHTINSKQKRIFDIYITETKCAAEKEAIEEEAEWEMRNSVDHDKM